MKRLGVGFAVVLFLSLILASLTVPLGANAQEKTTPPAAAGDKTTPPGATGTDKSVAPAATGADKTTPPGAAGDKTAPSAAGAAKTILIGFTASKTGKLNVEATRQINGLNLWVEQVNKAGGIKMPDGTKVKVETKYYDDESNKDRVQELYTRLISLSLIHI